MPTTYAHYRFGQNILTLLEEKNITFTSKEKDLFNIGLHGPDILFYYRPFLKTSVRSLGEAIHDEPGYIFMSRALSVINHTFTTAKAKKLATAYIYGFICHYALDLTCHPYVFNYTDLTGTLHSVIESDFDKTLLKLDGVTTPERKLLTDHIVIQKQYAKIIRPFYKGTTNFNIYESLISFKWITDMLVAPKWGIKRIFLECVLRLTPKYHSFIGMIINPKENSQCFNSNKRLLALYDEAIDVAMNLIHDFSLSLEADVLDNSNFTRTFSRI